MWRAKKPQIFLRFREVFMLSALFNAKKKEGPSKEVGSSTAFILPHITLSSAPLVVDVSSPTSANTLQIKGEPSPHIPIPYSFTVPEGGFKGRRDRDKYKEIYSPQRRLSQ
jgi:hypothetical protein